MRSEIKNLIEEIRQIREQYEAEVGTKKRRAWPRAMARQNGFKQLSVVEKKPKSLTVTDTDLGKANLSGSVTVTVTTPKGFLIEGLPPDRVRLENEKRSKSSSCSPTKNHRANKSVERKGLVQSENC